MRQTIKKFIRIVLNLLWWGLTAVILLTLLDVAGDRAQGRIPDIGGYSIIRITTGSMEPAIPTGTYILVKKTEPEKIRSGDIISFYSEDPLIYNLPNTHRVVRKRMQEDGTYLFETRGDNNFKDDELQVPESRLIGRYQENLESLTKFVGFFMTRGMLLLLLCMQGMCIVMAIYFHSLKKSLKKEQELSEEERIQQEVQRLIREAEQKKEQEQTQEEQA